ncbi:acyl-CoA thioesterase-1 [Symbiobacterium terraclitae]|uniref:Acyl-CoA thioesterase-1 n=1 Tax=Symbiobacterium terraclitae TaxID=557451 RepID=A0ABS4JU00_9FIRM|nr:acyl-CoA thioesterase-1 [Symbiobacterium terraclitae]
MRRSWPAVLLAALVLALTLPSLRRPAPELQQLTALTGPGAEQAADHASYLAVERAAGQASAVRTPDPGVDRTGWPVIVAFGDSLTAGHGVEPDRNYPSQLQALLDELGYRYRVVNAGVSGEMTAGGLSRVGTVLEHGPEIVILELGANDGMQAVPPDEVRANLAAIVEQLQAAGATVVLAGMRAPPNYGSEYEAAFARIYPDLAEAYGLPLIPFFLEGVAGSPYLNQRDGIHPTAEGYAIVVINVLETLEPLLRR